MRFQINTAKQFYSKEESIEFKKLGFTFHDYEGELSVDGKPEIELESLEALLSFAKHFCCAIVIHPVTEGLPILEIYNDYRE